MKVYYLFVYSAKKFVDVFPHNKIKTINIKEYIAVLLIFTTENIIKRYQFFLITLFNEYDSTKLFENFTQ